MGQYDNMLVRKDLDNLVRQMSNAKVEVIYIPGWGHTGVIFSKSAEPMLKIIEKINDEVAKAKDDESSA